MHGNAAFVDAHTLRVREEDGSERRLTAAHFVIATGSHPYRPPDVDFSNPRVLDSDTILKLQSIPESITIYGAGVIGCEYASIFVGLGCKVDLINTQKQLLSYLDDEIADALSYYLRELGVLVRNQEEYERVETQDDCVILHLKSGKKIKADAILWCNGRTGNTDTLALEKIGLVVTSGS